MKNILTQTLVILATLALSLTALAANQPEPARDETPQPASPPPQNNGTETNADDTQQVVGDLIQAVTDAAQALDGRAGDTNGQPADPKAFRSIRGQGTRGTAGSGTNAVSLSLLVANSATNHVAKGVTGIRLNFRNAPLSQVLDYLSDAAGFTISADSKVDLQGRISVWSNQPVDRQEAVALLNSALTANHYAATVEGNLLNIYVMDATTTPIPDPVSGSDYTNIPPTKDLVTQIVYVRNVEAGQLITSLQPLMPAGTGMTANQGANAIVITDTKANIRRMVQLVKVLDTASVAATQVKVFPLTYADAKELAQVVTQLFQPDSSNNQQGNRGGGPFGRFFGGGFPGGPGGGGNNNQSQQGRVAAPKVTAVADDRSNSLVVNGSDEQIAMVEELVKQIDVLVDDVAVLRVFRLRYADPQETADQLSTLFPDPTTQQSSRGQGGGGGFRNFFGGFNRGGNNNNSADPNSRNIKQTRVTAVADPRTSSVIVSAAKGLMDEIASIIDALDSDPAKKKKIYVVPVENRDPQEVVEEIQSVIAADTTGGNFANQRSSSQQSGSALSQRQQNNNRNQGNNNTSTSGFGNTSRTGSGFGQTGR